MPWRVVKNYQLSKRTGCLHASTFREPENEVGIFPLRVINLYQTIWHHMPIPVPVRSKAWVCGRSLDEIAGSNPTGGMSIGLVSVVCCHIEVSATGWSLVQKSPTCVVCLTECDCEASIMRRPSPTRALEPWKGWGGGEIWHHIAEGSNRPLLTWIP
jgi:hypothetical protein